MSVPSGSAIISRRAMVQDSLLGRRRLIGVWPHRRKNRGDENKNYAARKKSDSNANSTLKRWWQRSETFAWVLSDWVGVSTLKKETRNGGKSTNKQQTSRIAVNAARGLIELEVQLSGGSGLCCHTRRTHAVRMALPWLTCGICVTASWGSHWGEVSFFFWKSVSEKNQQKKISDNGAG